MKKTNHPSTRAPLPEKSPYINGYLRRFSASFSDGTEKPRDPLPQFLEEARRTGKKYFAQQVYAELAHGFYELSEAEKRVLREALYQLARGVSASKAFMPANTHMRGATREANRLPTEKTSRDEDLADLVENELTKMRQRGQRPAVTVASHLAAETALRQRMHARIWLQVRPVSWRTCYDAHRRRTKS